MDFARVADLLQQAAHRQIAIDGNRHRAFEIIVFNDLFAESGELTVEVLDYLAYRTSRHDHGFLTAGILA